MTISFRTRLFVVAALIVSTVLAAVIGAGWSTVLQVEVERLDQRLCMEARRLDRQPWQGEDPGRLEVDVMAKLRLGAIEQLMLRHEPLSGQPDFQSSHWRSELNIDQLRWADAKGQGLCPLSSFESRGSDWRAALYASASGRSFVAADLAETSAELQTALRRALTMVVPMALALAALGAWLLASLTMRPVNRLREAMRGVTQRGLDQRLATSGEDREFRELIAAYNAMLASLEKSFQQASRFSADAAHELKTPLTILQGRLEQAVSRSDNPAVQAELSSLQDEVGRLAGITRKLLLLSQADAGRLTLQLAPTDLSAMLGELLSDAEMLLGDQTLRSAIAPHLSTQADVLLIRQLFNNLISNAVRYCRPGGSIAVAARTLAGGIEVIFANPCETVAQDLRSHFFDRFFRGDASRNRRVEGSGLGLSLAREIARAHGGELVLMPGALDEVRLRLWLPGP